ncbi:MAG TPA: hypothetical protein DCK95_02415 [Anaerolineaceae bacterium]|nr:hypothetical protein [Anaerolineaceae bacterium]
MPKGILMQFSRFSKQHVIEAAELLAARSKQILIDFPLLPSHIVEQERTVTFLNALLERSESSGMVMLEKGRMIGYILGYYDQNLFFRRHVWVPFGGLALSEADEYQQLRTLYAAVGDNWIQDGVLNHYLVCPAIQEWQRAAFSLSFGQEQAYAVVSSTEEQPEGLPPQGITIREVQPADANQLASNGHWISAHLNTAQVWEPVPQEHLAEVLPGYAELADDDTSTTWVALDGEKLVAYVAIYTVDIGAIHYLGTPKAAHFAVAATHPDYRKRGIGRALFTHILNVAHQQGYEQVFTDWRTTNLEADRYWPTFGFSPFAYRLLRRVNPIYKPFTG